MFLKLGRIKVLQVKGARVQVRAASPVLRKTRRIALRVRPFLSLGPHPNQHTQVTPKCCSSLMNQRFVNLSPIQCHPNHRSCMFHGQIHWVCAGSTSDDHPLPASGDVDEPMGPIPREDHPSDSAQIQATEPASYQQLSRKIEKELVLHRRRGHTPFDSRCDHCVRSRSVVRHSRSHPGRSPIDHKLLLVQADFMFLEGCRFLILGLGVPS